MASYCPRSFSQCRADTSAVTSDTTKESRRDDTVNKPIRPFLQYYVDTSTDSDTATDSNDDATESEAEICTNAPTEDLPMGYINVKLHDDGWKKSTYIVIKQTATVRELILHASKTLHRHVNYMRTSVHNKVLHFKDSTTLEDHKIFNKATVHVKRVQPPRDKYYIPSPTEGLPRSLYSHCEDCGMRNCPFEDLFKEWNVHRLSKNQEKAYLILCQRFSLPSDVIKIIKDNNEDNGVRLGDALHRICHKNPNITQEEVIEFINSGNAQ